MRTTRVTNANPIYYTISESEEEAIGSYPTLEEAEASAGESLSIGMIPAGFLCLTGNQVYITHNSTFVGTTDEVPDFVQWAVEQ